MAKRNKPIHLILQYGYQCSAICDKYMDVIPIESTIKLYCSNYATKGTFNPTKVTCKHCLKHPKYKEAMDRVKYPLLFWKENV